MSTRPGTEQTAAAARLTQLDTDEDPDCLENKPLSKALFYLYPECISKERRKDICPLRVRTIFKKGIAIFCRSDRRFSYKS